MKLDDLIENKINIETEMYSSIIGESPSKGARSPILWNKAYKDFNINNQMYPLDVSADKLISLLNYLNADKSYTGGAITMPYKENIFEWLGENVSQEAKSIGAVNCLFRSENGNLFGTNTDGEASLLSAKDILGDLKGKKVLQLGCGGAGKAVAAFFAHEGVELTIATRSPIGIADFAKKISATSINWDEISDMNGDCEIIINTTSVGFRDDNSTPVTETMLTDSNLLLVYDIIYEPLKTTLLALAEKNGIATLNGLDMNLKQAVIAFNYANNIEDGFLTSEFMKEAE